MMHTYIHYKTVGLTYMLGSLILDLTHLFNQVPDKTSYYDAHKSNMSMTKNSDYCR